MDLWSIPIREEDGCPLPSNLTLDETLEFKKVFHPMFGLFIALHVFTLGLLYKRWHHPYLYQPERIIAVVSSFFGVAFASLILLREASGRTKENNLPCDILLVLIPLFPIQLVPSVIRLSMFRSRMLWYTKGIEAFNNEEKMLRYRRSSFKLSNPLMEFIWLMKAKVAEILRLQRKRRYDSLGDSDPGAQDALLRTRFTATSSYAAIWCCILTVFPFIVVTSVQYSLYPFYGKGCITCAVYPIQAMVGLGEVVLLLIYAFFVFRDIKAKGLPDPFGVTTELKRVFIVSGTLWMVGFLLFIVDPGHLNEKGIVNWGIFFVFAIGTSHNLQTTFPLLKSMRKSLPTELEDIVSNKYISLENILNIEPLFELFKEHLQREMSVENILFWKQTKIWLENYATASVEERDSRATALFNVFVRDGSMLQVNLPFEVRAEIEHVFHHHKTKSVDASAHFQFIPKTVFKEARPLIVRLMENDSFVRFLERQDVQKVLMEAISAGIITLQDSTIQDAEAPNPPLDDENA